MQTLRNDPNYLEHWRYVTADGGRGDAGAWVEDPARHGLLIRHEAAESGKGTPGGGHEPGASVEATPRREVSEETGVGVEIVASDGRGEAQSSTPGMTIGGWHW